MDRPHRIRPVSLGACRLLGKSGPRFTGRESPARRGKPAGPRAPHPRRCPPSGRSCSPSSTATGSRTSPRPRSGRSCSTRAPTWPASPPCTGSAPEGEVRERRAQAAHPPRVRPELVADGPGPGMDLGYHETERTVARHSLRPVRDARHLLPQGDPLGGSRHRERRPRQSIHRERDHRQRRRRPRRHPRRQRHLDDLQTVASSSPT